MRGCAWTRCSNTPVAFHPQSEVLSPSLAAARAVLARPLTVDTLGRRFHVEWDPQAPVRIARELDQFCQEVGVANARELVGTLEFRKS